MKNILKNLFLFLTFCCVPQLFAAYEEELSSIIKSKYDFNDLNLSFGDDDSDSNPKDLNLSFTDSDSMEALNKLKELIETNKIDINKKAPYDKSSSMITPLYFATFYPDTSIIEYLVNKGADVNTQNNDGKTALEKITFTDYENLGEQERLNIIKLFLLNNATFDMKNYVSKSNFKKLDQKIKDIFDEINNYKNDVTKNKAKDALVKGITNNGKNNSAFSKDEWLTLAILNKDYKQIQYAIDQKIFTPFDILKYLALTPHMPLDIFNPLWDQTTNEQKVTLLSIAKEHNNKKFGKKVAEYNKMLRVLKLNDDTQKDISKNIVSYL